ncbi:hypothetical protein [Bacillus haynesii]|uniref:hypothetical protein n=1 Tax=Bacillus haynesii TaxID=1925021 RepID=UPI0022818604|nr:hypothetical protein [Bacillus haynesii]MCY8408982.1 hypothetical protein [Bacillus haynesii]MCY8433469.1 hypothetical protein [Bacillus haynesii]MCY8557851.1 hypothetical protein [Bacillus haynesii]
MEYKLSSRLEQKFREIDFESLVVDSLFDESAKKVRQWIDSEIKAAFDHFNLTLDEAEGRAFLEAYKDGTKVLIIDGETVLIIHKPQY